MTKTFIYNVNGTTFEDTKAFGEAWKAAAAMAKEERKHTRLGRIEGATGESLLAVFGRRDAAVTLSLRP